MPSLSLPAANILLLVSNITQIVGTILIILGFAGAWFASNVRDEHSAGQVSTLQTDLEHERSKRERIEHRMVPRSLTPEEQQRLVATLRQTPRPVNVKILRLGDQEAGAYADDIISAMRQGGATVQVSTVGMMAPPQYGILITVRVGDPKASAVSAAFARAGIQAQVYAPDQPLPTPFDAQILVGLKPSSTL